MKRKLLLSATAILLTLCLAAGAAVAEDSADTLFSRVQMVYNIVRAHHKDGADLDKFVSGAIRGGLEALGDPHTNYFAPDEFSNWLSSLNGQFSGIGAYLEQEGSHVIIAAPIKGTPAFEAGLVTGDRILEANGTSLEGATVEKAVGLLRGPTGTEVTVKIHRPSENRTFTLTLKRAVIVIPEVESKMLDKEVGYIQILNFGDDSVREFYKAVDTLKAQGAKALVLDLRQNPGGYLDAAIDIAGAFVPQGKTVVWEVGKNGKTERTSSGRLINLPTAVLVDKGSASASEVLAGAIQDYGAAPLVGTKTFGKGTVQQILYLVAGGGMKVTTAEYLTPKERRVDGVGLTPDHVVELPDLSERTGPMTFKRLLKVSTVGLDVLYLQYRLQDLGYEPEVDGYFGLKTKSAVLAFARAHKLPQEPVVDSRFMEVLNRQVSESVKRGQRPDEQLNKAKELVRSKLK